MTLAPFLVRPSAAHLGHLPIRAERVVMVSLEEPPSIVYVVSLGRTEAARARRDADRDRDGQVTAAESNAFVDGWTATLGRAVRVAVGRGDEPGARSAEQEVGAAPLSSLRLVSVEAMGLAGAVEVSPSSDDTAAAASLAPWGVQVTWSYALRLGADADRLRIDDASSLAPFDLTDVLVHDTATRPLIGLGESGGALGTSPRLSFVDAGRGPAIRSLRIVWRPRRKDVAPAVPAMFVGGGLLVLLVIYARRRRCTRS